MGKYIYVSSDYNTHDFSSKRIWRTDGKYEPFVYIIEEKETGIRYIGSRTKHYDIPCLESDLGSVYFTSSNYVKWESDEFRIIEIIKCASNHDAIILEYFLIEQHNAVESEYFYNKSLAGKTFNMSGTNLSESAKKRIGDKNRARPRTEEEKNKIRKSLITFYNSDRSSELKRIRSESMKGEKNPFYGKNHGDNHPKGMLNKKHSEESKRKIADAVIGRVCSDDTKEKLSSSKMGENNPMYGVDMSNEHKLKISESCKGIKKSKETKRRMSEGHKKRKKKLCVHCAKLFDPAPFKRYHGDNCKKNGVN